MPKVEYWDHRPTDEWKQALSTIPRFSAIDAMIHRTSLYDHVNRVQSLSFSVAQACKRADYEFDMSIIERRSLHHDDPEVETTDIPSPVKRAMTPEERLELRERELGAARRLAGRFSTLPPDTYISDQEEVANKETIENQIVDVADKLDGLCETIHELRCGNKTFRPVLENYREIFVDLEQHPIYGCLDIAVPSLEDVEKFPIDIELLKEGRREEFWKNVFDPSLPNFVRLWMRIMSRVGTFRTLACSIRLFPGWTQELMEEESRRTGRQVSEAQLKAEDFFFGRP